MSIDVGTLLEDRYRILEKLGAGAMGAVFTAENLRIGRRVAIKVLHPHVANIDGAAKRFELEARAATSAGSEHIIEIIDFGWVSSGELFMVMELLEGETMKDRMKGSKKIPLPELLNLCRQILKGLEKAHAAGIVHRDLKPDNIFIAREWAGQKDWVKILDFGICRLSDDNVEPMTQTGMVLGTPHYMSPEHVRGSHHVDARSDLYAVGVMMYRALAGEAPFNGTNVTELMFKIAYDPMPDIAQRLPGIDPRLAAAVMKGMARDPNERYATAGEFEQALAELATGPFDATLQQSERPSPSVSPPSHVAAGSMPPRAESSLQGKTEGSEGAHSIPLVLGKTAPGRAAAEAAPQAKRSFATPLAVMLAVACVGGGVAFIAHRQGAQSTTAGAPTSTDAAGASPTGGPLIEPNPAHSMAPAIAESAIATESAKAKSGPAVLPTATPSALSSPPSSRVPSEPAPSAHPPAVTTGPPHGIATDNPYK